VLPALMGVLANKASTTAGASGLLDMIRRSKLDSRAFADTSGAIAAQDGVASLISAGRPLLDFVLGTRTNSVTDWIASFAGISKSSSTSLLTLAVPLVVGQISKFVGSTSLTASSLQNLLADQRAVLQDAPAGLAAALGVSELGWAPVGGAHATERAAAAAKARVAGTYESEPRGGTAWWKWALPLLLLALIPLYFAMRRTAEPQVGVQGSVVPRGEVPTSGAAPGIAALGDLIERRLPLGVTLRIPSLGVENKLIAFIEDPSLSADRETWFSFDRLEFETDRADLKPSSREQLRNIAEILRAYPNVNVKIGGYTDNVGDDDYNLKLSADRASNTLNEIVNLGVDRSRLESEGYGETHPIADNATADGRQRNRRIDIRVTKK
jgi:outer membrane protein OmpA-like peptidoglycan-associated protein